MPRISLIRTLQFRKPYAYRKIPMYNKKPSLRISKNTIRPRYTLSLEYYSSLVIVSRMFLGRVAPLPIRSILSTVPSIICQPSRLRQIYSSLVVSSSVLALRGLQSVPSIRSLASTLSIPLYIALKTTVLLFTIAIPFISEEFF